MELRLEVAEGCKMPVGSYVAVKLGDALKQGRYEPNRSYQFPNADKRRHAKIDVFKHVGSSAVLVNPDAGNHVSEIFVASSDPTVEDLRLKVDMKPQVSNTVPSRTPLAPSSKQKSMLRTQAHDYIAKHKIEDKFTACMKKLLQFRPEDPIEFVCSFLRDENHKPGAAGASLPASDKDKSKTPVPAAAAAKEAPTPAPASREPSLSEVARQARQALVVSGIDGRLAHTLESALFRPQPVSCGNCGTCLIPDRDTLQTGGILTPKDGVIKITHGGGYAESGQQEEKRIIKAAEKASVALVTACHDGTLRQHLDSMTACKKSAPASSPSSPPKAAAALSGVNTLEATQKVKHHQQASQVHRPATTPPFGKYYQTFCLAGEPPGELAARLFQHKSSPSSPRKAGNWKKLRAKMALLLLHGKRTGEIQKIIYAVEAEASLGMLETGGKCMNEALEQVFLRQRGKNALVTAVKDGVVGQVTRQWTDEQKALRNRALRKFDSVAVDKDALKRVQEIALREAGISAPAASSSDESLKALRQQAGKVLLTATVDGSLAKVLSEAKEENDPTTSLRKQVGLALQKASQDGTLLGALQKTKQENDPTTSLRKQAGLALQKASQDGTLLGALQETKQEHEQSTKARLQELAANSLQAAADNGSLENVVNKEVGRKHLAHELLLSSGQSGLLAEAIDKELKNGHAPQKLIQEDVNVLREKAGDTLKLALQNGNLGKVIQEETKLRSNAREAIVKASDAGTLADAISQEDDSRLRNKARSVLTSAANDGSLRSALVEEIQRKQAKQETAPSTSQSAEAVNKDTVLRDRAREVLTAASRDGSLIAALTEEVDRKKRALQAFEGSSESGALATSIDEEIALMQNTK